MFAFINLILFFVSVTVCFDLQDIRTFKPKDPVLTLEPDNGPFMEGDQITASCKVHGRPGCEVNLFIGSEISRGLTKYLFEYEDVVVTKEFILSSEYDNKFIQCTVYHKTWGNRIPFAIRSISVLKKNPTVPVSILVPLSPPPTSPGVSNTKFICYIIMIIVIKACVLMYCICNNASKAPVPTANV